MSYLSFVYNEVYNGIVYGATSISSTIYNGIEWTYNSIYGTSKRKNEITEDFAIQLPYGYKNRFYHSWMIIPLDYQNFCQSIKSELEYRGYFGDFDIYLVHQEKDSETNHDNVFELITKEKKYSYLNEKKNQYGLVTCTKNLEGPEIRKWLEEDKFHNLL